MDRVGGELKDKIRAKEDQEGTRTITEDRDKDRLQAWQQGSVQEMNYRPVLTCVQGSVPGCSEPV